MLGILVGENIQYDRYWEKIKCPECGEKQWAQVEHSEPWYTYVKECECGWIITESEWMCLISLPKGVKPDGIEIDT